MLGIKVDKEKPLVMEEETANLEKALRLSGNRGQRVILDFYDHEIRVQGAYMDYRNGDAIPRGMDNQDPTWTYVHGVWRKFEGPQVNQMEVTARVGWIDEGHPTKFHLQLLGGDGTRNSVHSIIEYSESDYLSTHIKATGYDVHTMSQVLRTFSECMQRYRRRVADLEDIDKIGQLD